MRPPSPQPFTAGACIDDCSPPTPLHRRHSLSAPQRRGCSHRCLSCCAPQSGHFLPPSSPPTSSCISRPSFACSGRQMLLKQSLATPTHCCGCRRTASCHCGTPLCLCATSCCEGDALLRRTAVVVAVVAAAATAAATVAVAANPFHPSSSCSFAASLSSDDTTSLWLSSWAGSELHSPSPPPPPPLTLPRTCTRPNDSSSTRLSSLPSFPCDSTQPHLHPTLPSQPCGGR